MKSPPTHITHILHAHRRDQQLRVALSTSRRSPPPHITDPSPTTRVTFSSPPITWEHLPRQTAWTPSTPHRATATKSRNPLQWVLFFRYYDIVKRCEKSAFFRIFLPVKYCSIKYYPYICNTENEIKGVSVKRVFERLKKRGAKRRQPLDPPGMEVQKVPPPRQGKGTF